MLCLRYLMKFHHVVQDFEKLTSSSKMIIPVVFVCLDAFENDIAVKQAQLIWSNMLEIIDFWKILSKSK